MNARDERDGQPLWELIWLAQSQLDLDRYGFKESYRAAKPGKVIYDSEWCRLELVWSGWDHGGDSRISIYYGRLHAPDEEVNMVWKGEVCHCWHDVHPVLHFLDVRPPAEVARLNDSHPLTEAFYQDEFLKKFYRRQPEWLVQMHVTIWQYYGQRLFELFDLRQPELWEQYRQFLKEFYDIKGRIPETKPPLDKVC